MIFSLHNLHFLEPIIQGQSANKWHCKNNFEKELKKSINIFRKRFMIIFYITFLFSVITVFGVIPASFKNASAFVL